MATIMLEWLGESWFGVLGGLIVDAELGDQRLTGPVGFVVGSAGARGRAGSVVAQASIDVVAGRVVGWHRGVIPVDALATITLSQPDALAALEGHVEPSVLFMQGRLKASGDMTSVLAVLAATGTHSYDVARGAIQRQTAH